MHARFKVHDVFKTDERWSGLFLRVTLSLVIFPHGAQKLMGWFGGNGFVATMGFFTEKMNFPWVVAFMVVLIESLGAFALLFGLLTRCVASGLAAIMVGAVAVVHWQHGFFMNWFGQQTGEGFEYHVLAFGISIALVAVGGGRYAADHLIARRVER